MPDRGIDFDRLTARCLGNADLAAELVTLFRQNAGPEAAVARAALEAGDTPTAAASIHRLKSMASTVVASELQRLLGEAERAPTLAGFARVMDELALCLSVPPQERDAV